MNAGLFTAVMVTSTLACLVTTVGIYVIRRYETWGSRNTAYFMSFAAGVLISVSFIHIIPKSFTMNSSGPLFLLAGFMGLYLFNRFLNALVCNEYGRPDVSIGIVPLLAIGLHSFLDGVIYSVTFSVALLTGVLAAIGMVLHEFPEGIVAFLLLKRGGFDRRKATIYALLAAAISTPLGALLSFPLISRIDQPTLGALLALSAGALVYVGASHLLPAVERENKRFSIIALLTGIFVAGTIVLLKG